MTTPGLEDLRAAAQAAERGKAQTAVAAWLAVLAADPDDAAAHGFFLRRVHQLGRAREAVPGLWRLIQDAPAEAGLRRVLARCLARMRRWAAAAKAWRSVREMTEFDDEAAREGVFALGERYKETQDPAVLDEVRAIAAADTRRRASLWTQLARTFEAAGDVDQAIAAWSTVIEVDGLGVSAQESRDRLEHRRSGRISPSGPRILLVGNCQVQGIGMCLRRLHPQAEVIAELWAAHAEPQAAKRFLDEVAGFDIVVGQLIGGKASHPFKTEDIAARAAHYIGIPRIAFTGFHPDLIRLLGTTVPAQSPFRAWHSAIISGAFAAGLPRQLVPDYFNAYVYGRLGYFDAFAKAEALLRRESAAVGFDIDPVLAAWAGREAFVHMPDHPKIAFLDAMAREICHRADLAVAADAELPADAQAERLIWPVYREVGKRLGVTGATSFIPHHPPVAMNLRRVVAHFYTAYAQHGVPQDPAVARTAQALTEILRPSAKPFARAAG